MKRYLTFIGHIYYPSGGMSDFKGDFDTIEEAQTFIKEEVDKENYHKTAELRWEYVWAHIWDTETRSEVWSK